MLGRFDAALKQLRTATSWREAEGPLAILPSLIFDPSCTRDDAALMIRGIIEMRAELTGLSVSDVLRSNMEAWGLDGMDEEEFERIFVFGCEAPPLPPPAAP